MEAGDTAQMENKVVQTFQKSFVQVQSILDQNRVIIHEINQNHESKIPDNLNRNVGLIKELNNNIRRVVDLYADLSSSFTKSMDSDDSDSGAKKRFRSIPPSFAFLKVDCSLVSCRLFLVGQFLKVVGMSCHPKR
ncbi:hypothetical protein IEQ34_002853 [Dendrobium chrysotoxum]|uniref:Protein EARLY FLOWERING 4 domain-containing protein n=1 Tax=Dendrobium chrysotoxum TaxID=161865 RepID=A0AAV7H150_DENCH|nr:hypothetical protein IEQ34_002853 [Dendrobium chrysotoxum]